MARSESELIDLLAEEYAAREVIDYRDKISQLGKVAESPIERVMLAALLLERQEGIEFFKFNGKLQPFDSLMFDGRHTGVEYAGAIYPQAEIGRYRLDFYLEVYDKETGKLWYGAAIECDGHDFHEKTKEQARRDKQRDRWFQAQGIAVFRFTGSEIWADPSGCADQVYDAFYAAWRRAFR